MSNSGMTRSIAVALLAVPLVCAAQAIPRPDVKVGDSWTYQRIDDANQPLSKYTMRVVSAERDVIRAVNVQSGQAGEWYTTHTADWNAVKLGRRQSFDPHSGWFKFPLQVGETYSAEFGSIFTNEMRGRTVQFDGRNSRTVKVVGWEEVVVPAGKFRALHIVSEGLLNRTDTPRPTMRQARDVFWYVPEIKRWAKMTRENQPLGRGGSGLHIGEELLAYELK